MADLPGIAPGAPFIPEQPQTVIQRQIIEWSDRADIAQHAFDGQWRTLQAYPDFKMHLVERWVHGPQYDEYQHAVCPMGTFPPADCATGFAAPTPSKKSGTENLIEYFASKRKNGEALTLAELVEETLCKAFRTPTNSGAVI